MSDSDKIIKILQARLISQDASSGERELIINKLAEIAENEKEKEKEVSLFYNIRMILTNKQKKNEVNSFIILIILIF